VAESGRKRLLGAAVTGLVALDPAALTVDAICGRAEVKPPTLYHHFGSKDGLLAAAVDDLVLQWLAVLDAVVPRGGPLPDALPVALAQWEEMILSPQRPLAVYAWSVMLLAPSSGEVRAALKRARIQGEALMAEGLRSFDQLAVQAVPVATMIVSFLIATAVQHELDNDPGRVRDALHGLGVAVMAIAGAGSPAGVPGD